MRRGIFGGTFDPPHVGHLMVASDACEALGLDQLTWVPNARQPLKEGEGVSAPADRLEMVRRAVAGDSRFSVDACEVDRGGLSYSVETLAHFASTYPGEERYFLIGADVGRSFSRWREPRRILQQARLAILYRWVDQGVDDASLLAPFEALADASTLPPIVVRTRRVDLSSTEVRERARTGRPLTGFVPESVARFIVERGLYHTALS